MISKAKFLLISLFLLFCVQGCWGMRETDEMGYILVVGLDRGTQNIIKVTFQLALPQPLEGGQEKEDLTEIIEIEAASLFGAEQLLNAVVSKHLSLIHNTAIIVSEEIAREGLNKYINPLVRNRDLRRTNFLLVVRGEANEFIKANKGLIFEKYPSRQLDILMVSASLTGFSYKSDIHSFYQGLKSPGKHAVLGLVGVQKSDEMNEEAIVAKSYETKIKEEIAYLPGEIPRQGGNKIDLIGQAVFQEDHLVGFLNGQETRYYQMLTGELKKSVFSFPEPEDLTDALVVMEIRKRRQPKIKIKIAEEETVIEVQLFLSGKIMSIQSGKNYEQGELEKELIKYISALISEESEQLVRKTQEEYASDIFGFGEYSRGLFSTWSDWVAYQWLEKYPFCRIKVQTSLEIINPGMMTKTVPNHYH